MLPGRKYTPEDALRILRSRIWWVLVPFALVSVAVALWAQRMPDRYRSETTIAVLPQRIPESYIRSTVTGRIEDRLPAIREQILTRSRYEQLIVAFDLYSGTRANGTMSDAVDLMIRDVDVRIVRSDAFRVSYVGSTPQMARNVAEKLGALFVDEGLRYRQDQAVATDQFLESSLEEARVRLIEHEQRLENYRRQHAGELPEQLASNMQALQGLHMQIQSIVESVNRDQDRKILLERQLAELATSMPPDLPPASPAPTATGPNAPTGGTTEQQLTGARATLEGLLARYSTSHPDVLRMQRIVGELEKRLEAELLQRPVSAGVSTGLSPAELARRKREADLRSDLDQLIKQIEDKRATEARLREQAAVYQRRADAAPTRSTELVELTRDYATLQARYQGLLAKKEDSKMAAKLETAEIGERLSILEHATLPDKPFSPNRQQYSFIGMFAGLGIGMALVLFLEYRDRSFRTDEEVAALVALPVLATVPEMQPVWARKQRRRRAIAVNLGLGSTVLGCLAVLAYTFVR